MVRCLPSWGRVSVDLAASQDFGGFPVVQAGSAGPGRFVVGFVVLRSAAERGQCGPLFGGGFLVRLVRRGRPSAAGEGGGVWGGQIVCGDRPGGEGGLGGGQSL
jgi:hypothetical protein